MSYHRGGHAGAVAVSYGTSSMAPLSPSRRYSSGSTGTNTSGIGSSTSKFNTYRSSGTSILDRPSNYYSSSSRSSYLSEYRRSFCSPARSVSSAYSDAGTGSAYSSSIRFSPSTSSSSSSSISSRERSETRDSLGSLATSAADIIAKYSPSGYVPNIHSNAHFTSIYGGNAADARNSARDRDREPPADLGSPSAPPSGTVGTISGSRASRIPWRPPLGTLLVNHALPDSSPSSTEALEDHSGRGATSNERSGPDTIVRARDNLVNQRTEDRGDAPPPPPPPPPPLPPSFLSSSSASSYSTNSSSWEPSSEAANGSPPIVPSSVESERSSSTGSRNTGDSTTPGASTSRRTEVISTENASASDDASPSSSAAASHRNDYRSVSEQIEGSPTSRSTRNRLQAYRDERCGLNGLRNIGNTCFMNSVIQCLSNTRPLLEYLLNEQYLNDINTTTSSMKGALIKAFSQVIQELWEVGGDHVVNTTSLKSQIQRFAPRFMGYSQQDAQEFLRYLLEGLHEDVNRVTIKPQPIHTDIPDHYTDSQKAAESWKRYLRSEDSTIVDVFVGQLRSSLHCTFCGHVSVTLDPFWDLSLPIPTRSGTVKLNQCLEHFTKEEVLDGDEKPTCSKCQMRRKCTKSFSIQKFPKILVIHLKRFSPMERFRGKLNVLVDFPLSGLDLGAFAAPRVQGCTYNLYGVANHSGTTYSGHYTAYCKHPYSGDWHEYNDSRVSSVPGRSVVSSEGYVLFYEQQPHSSHL